MRGIGQGFMADFTATSGGDGIYEVSAGKLAGQITNGVSKYADYAQLLVSDRDPEPLWVPRRPAPIARSRDVGLVFVEGTFQFRAQVCILVNDLPRLLEHHARTFRIRR